MAQPLLGHNLALRPDRFACDPEPSPFDHLGPPCQQTCSRAGECIRLPWGARAVKDTSPRGAIGPAVPANLFLGRRVHPSAVGGEGRQGHFATWGNRSSRASKPVFGQASASVCRGGRGPSRTLRNVGQSVQPCQQTCSRAGECIRLPWGARAVKDTSPRGAIGPAVPANLFSGRRVHPSAVGGEGRQGHFATWGNRSSRASKPVFGQASASVCRGGRGPSRTLRHVGQSVQPCQQTCFRAGECIRLPWGARAVKDTSPRGAIGPALVPQLVSCHHRLLKACSCSSSLLQDLDIRFCARRHPGSDDGQGVGPCCPVSRRRWIRPTAAQGRREQRGGWLWACILIVSSPKARLQGVPDCLVVRSGISCRL